MAIELLGKISPFVSKYGYLAIIISSLFEGASIPFPGTIIFILAGLSVFRGGLNIYYAIILGGLTYSIASILPYYIGKSIRGDLYNFLQNKCRIPGEKIMVMEKLFSKYGEISICISRPFFIGNYISYFAGINEVNIWKFLLLTFIGILPWNAMYMFLGYYFRGNIDNINLFLKENNIFFVLVIFIILIAILLLRLYKNTKK